MDRLRPRERNVFSGFTAAELEKLENLFQEYGVQTLNKEFCQRTACTFSRLAGRMGKPIVKPKEIQSWFEKKQRDHPTKVNLPVTQQGEATPSHVISKALAADLNACIEREANGSNQDQKAEQVSKEAGGEVPGLSQLEFEAKSSKDAACRASEAAGRALIHLCVAAEAVAIRGCSSIEEHRMTQESNKDKCHYAWNDEVTVTFLKFLHDFQRLNGRNNCFNWKVLTPKFELKTSTQCQQNTLKNRYNTLKKMWKLWKTLKDSDTGLGWDYERNCIDASDEWWTTKLAENNEYRVFKKNALHPQVLSSMEMLFVGTVATGSRCVAPSMAPPPSSTPIEVNDQDAEQADWDDFVIEDDMNNDQDTKNMTILEEENQPLQCPNQSHGKGKKTHGTSSHGVNKRNVKRKSGGKSEYEKHLALSNEANRKMIALCDAETQRSTAEETSNKPPSVTGESMAVLANMVQDGLIRAGSPVWCFAVTFLMTEAVSTMFMLIPGNEERVQWLEWEYKKEEKKGTLPDV